ncbi:MAG: hypothetical protein R6X02_14780 [Enhygromyxa sp.]
MPASPKPFARTLITLLATLLVSCAGLRSAQAAETQLEVRMINVGSKFLGDSVGGARVTIIDPDTNAVLAQGVTQGTTGDTELIMTDRQPHHASVVTADAAVFSTTLDLDRPRVVRVEATGPLDHPQALQTTTTTALLLPGRDRTGAQGIVLEVTGLIVDTHQVALTGSTLRIQSQVMMLCGCPFTPGGLWDTDDLEVVAVVTRGEGDELVGETELVYAGSPSEFRGTLGEVAPGDYRVTVIAFQPSTGNAGTHRELVSLGR